MWNKIVAWLMAMLTAMFNNFGFYQQPDTPYTGDPGYTIQRDAVNYKDMYSWYTKSFVGTDSCRVDNIKHETPSTGTNGVAFPIAGVPFNPDAELTLSDESVIVAPQECKVTTQPTSSSNRIVIENDLPGNYGFKMEIVNPKRWFCCVDANPDATGKYRHSQSDHRVTLKQGDVVAIASSDTELIFYRGSGDSGGPSKADLRTFLRAFDSEVGDGSLNLSGDAEQVLTKNEYLSDSLFPRVSIDEDKLFAGGPSGWNKSGNRWWWGRGGTAGKDYPANQYIVYDGYYYYFDSEGWMVTGWADDGYYYSQDTDEEHGYPTKFKEGALCADTIVPASNGSSQYVYVNDAGVVDNEAGLRGASGDLDRRTIQAGLYVYTYNESGDYFKMTSDITGSNIGGSGNNQGGSDIVNQVGNTGSLTDTQWDDLMAGRALSTAYSGWWKHGTDWVYLDAGRFNTQGIITGWNDGSAYCKDVDGMYYFFDSDTNVLLQGEGYGGDLTIMRRDGNDSERWFMVLNKDLGVFKSTWILDAEGVWRYADENGALYRSPSYASTPTVYKAIPAGSSEYYVFDREGVLDVTTPEIVVNINLSPVKLRLNPDSPDSPRIVE